MPKKAYKNNFFAYNFWTMEYSDVQKVVESLCNNSKVSNLILTGCRQFGKSFWIYRHLLLDACVNPSKLYAIVIPLDSELDRFLSEQLIKPFGKDKDGNTPQQLEDVMIEMKNKAGSPIYIKVVKHFSRSGVPCLTLFNNSKIYFFAGNANPEQHIPGYTFRLVIQDEWSKFKRDITNLIQPTLIHEKGTLISTTTLNEEDPNNWFSKEINSFKDKGQKIEGDLEKTRGLDIWKKEFNETLTVMNSNREFEEKRIHSLRLLILGDFEKIYPWIHNGQAIYLKVQSDYKLNLISEEDYQILYRCNPSVRNIQILSNYSRERNDLYLESYQDIESLCTMQLIGYDHGKGTDNTCPIGWTRLGIILNDDNLDYEQFVILDSGNLQGEKAEMQNVSKFIADFNLPVSCDTSMFKVSYSGGREFPDVHRFFKYEPKLNGLMFPSNGLRLNNDSRDRINFWQRAMLNSKETDFIQYQRPFSEELGSQIYILQDKNKPSLNSQLIWEIENYKLKPDRYKLELKEPRKSKIDTWDSASMAILGWQRNKQKLLAMLSDKKVSRRPTLAIKKIVQSNYRTGNPLNQGVSVIRLNNIFG